MKVHSSQRNSKITLSAAETALSLCSLAPYIVVPPSPANPSPPASSFPSSKLSLLLLLLHFWEENNARATTCMQVALPSNPRLQSL